MGGCECQEGTELVGDVCFCIGPGEIAVDGRCVCDESKLFVADGMGGCECQEGFELVGDVCEPICPTFVAKSEARFEPDVQNKGVFGRSVLLSSSGSRFVVGSPAASGDQGVSTIFDFSGTDWEQSTILVSSDGSGGDNFGWCHAMSPDESMLVIGAPFANGYHGKLYVFNFNGTGWEETAILDPIDEDYTLGFSVSMTGDGSRLAVGAPYADGVGYKRGKSYIFDFNGVDWEGTAILRGSDNEDYDYFGYDLSMSDDGSRLIVAAPSTGWNPGRSNGRFYVFDFDGTNWEETAIVEASDATNNAFFGGSVSLSPEGSRLVVGSNNANNDQGKTYVFDFDGTDWEETAILEASDGTSGELFGVSVSITADGSRLAVGASRASNGEGKTYVFDFNGMDWEESAILDPSDEARDYLGQAVSWSADGYQLASGAFTSNSGEGKAYVFSCV